MKVQTKEMETEQRKTNETKSWILSEQHNTRPPPARSRKKIKYQPDTKQKKTLTINKKIQCPSKRCEISK